MAAMTLLFVALLISGLVATAQERLPAPSHPLLVVSPYVRSEWLSSWPDADGDCQNLRAEILIEQSLIPVATNRNGCLVLGGRWIGAYTGRMFRFANEVDIEHIVALSEAHRLGGAEWSREKKREFATDPLNLLVVGLSQNRSKGDRSPGFGSGFYMPPMGRCHFLTVYRARVLEKYELDMVQDLLVARWLRCGVE